MSLVDRFLQGRPVDKTLSERCACVRASVSKANTKTDSDREAGSVQDGDLWRSEVNLPQILTDPPGHEMISGRGKRGHRASVENVCHCLRFCNVHY